MDFQVEFYEKYLLARAFGQAEVKVFGDLLENIFQHEKWHPGMSYVVDYTDLDASNLNTNDIRQIALITRFLRENSGVTRSSIVAPRDIEFGLVRMWSAFMETNDIVETEVFRTRDEALTWVANSN